MGLAASQVRLLLLTARKDDVESNLMFVSNERLSLARQSANLSKDYNNALNATQLTWTNNGTDDINLTYNLLMSPNSSNVLGQYMIADTSNRAILNDTYANIFGTNLNSGSNTGSVTEAQFLAAMGAGGGVVAAGQGKNANRPGATRVGGTTGGDYTEIENNANTILQTMKDAKMVDANGKVTSAAGDGFLYSPEQISAIQGALDAMGSNIATKLGTSEMQSVAQALQKGGNSRSGGTNIDKNLLAEYQYLMQMQRTVKAAQAMIIALNGQDTADGKAICTAALNLLLAGGTVNDQMHSGSNINRSNEVEDLLRKGWTASHNGLVKGYSDADHAIKVDGQALDYNFTGGSTVWGGNSNDLLGGTPWGSDDDGDYGETEDLAYFDQNITSLAINAEKANGGTNSNSNSNSDAAFYSNMYYFIQKNGWVRASSIDKGDGSYLQSMILNGTAHLCEMNDDGTWEVVSDTDAPLDSQDKDSTKAKAEYDAAKDKLDCKEKQMDLQMNNLDSERSALDTEIDSVKTIINKNIERSFKMFDA
ncbi:MAG: hypothetical protein WCY19_06235 [Candidatus Gastranaerophilaceae bacterium]